MTSTRKIQKNDDGTRTYRGYRIHLRDDKRYFVGWMSRVEPATTLGGIAANIDAYIAAEEKACTPVLRSDGTYCSPRCGVGCTKAAHDEAQRLGAALAKLLGTGWEPSVWENGMWRYAANINSEGVEVTVQPGKARGGHREGVDEYTCYLNTQPQFIARSTDPREAFEQALLALEQHVAQLGSVVSVLRRVPA